MPNPIKPLENITNIPVRFFIWDAELNDNEGDYIECDESDFIDAEGAIEYDRNTVFDNGVSQICLTKNPFAGC